jgi:hypothetical protein
MNMRIKDKLIIGLFIMFLALVFNIVKFEKDDVVSSSDIIIETTETEESIPKNEESITVYVTPTGKRYHLKRTCAGKNAIETTLREQQDETTPCKKCAL